MQDEFSPFSVHVETEGFAEVAEGVGRVDRGVQSPWTGYDQREVSSAVERVAFA